MLEAALAAGVAAAGGDALLGGVLPTPAAAILVKRLGWTWPRSSPPPTTPIDDNGIKFFSAQGTKLDDESEARIESLLDEPATAAEVGRRPRAERRPRGLPARAARPPSRSTSPVATSSSTAPTAPPTAPARRSSSGSAPTVEAIGAEPDGRNINAGCGSTHLEPLAERVAGSDAEIGFAFDGDGDRMLAVDGNGRVHDGDELIALAARGMADRGELEGGVVVTVMSNFGFHQAMEEAGIEVAVTQVGDRYVIDEMRRRGWALGGEQSGHIIASDFVATGDGIAAALMTMRELGEARLADAAPMREAAPDAGQRQGRRPRGDGRRGRASGRRWSAEGEALEGRGRVLLRPSGTEPLVRVMVEAPSAEEAEAVCGRLVDVVRTELA